MDAALGNGGL
ncbi:unnamed protein product, partial [Rotaria socialis]